MITVLLGLRAFSVHPEIRQLILFILVLVLLVLPSTIITVPANSFAVLEEVKTIPPKLSVFFFPLMFSNVALSLPLSWLLYSPSGMVFPTAQVPKPWAVLPDRETNAPMRAFVVTCWYKCKGVNSDWVMILGRNRLTCQLHAYMVLDDGNESDLLRRLDDLIWPEGSADKTIRSFASEMIHVNGTIRVRTLFREEKYLVG